MKTAIYDIEGMHCGSCEARVKSALETIGSVTMADISLKDNSATLSLSKNVDTDDLQKALKEIGAYTISKKNISDSGTDWVEPSITTYQPLILIIGFIAGVTFNYANTTDT
jgi:copper chaperone CopZ